MIDVCERCHEPLVGDGRKPGLCVDCTADDFGGCCEECGEEVAITEHIDGLCPACAVIAAEKQAKHWTGGECYYASVIDGPRYGLLAGPFKTHDEALGIVDKAREKAIEADPRAHFYGFGTAKAPTGAKNGVLNDLLNIEVKRQ